MHLQTVYQRGPGSQLPERQLLKWIDFGIPSSALMLSSHASSFSIFAAVRSPGAEAQVIGDFSVTTTSLRTVVLAERGLLGRVVIRVIADNVADQRGVGQTVRNMELGTQFVRHRVTHAEEGVGGERDTGDSRGTVYALTGNRVLGTFVIGSWQVLFQQFQRLQRLPSGELSRKRKLPGRESPHPDHRTHSDFGISITRLASTMALSGVSA